jgi:myo-inositol-1(or 4)-monophosphatase
MVGVVHAPFTHDTYCAIRGSGATCNDCKIEVSKTTQLNQALVGTGFPHDRSDVSRPIERITRLVSHCQDIRRAGSPALDISWVACGRLDAHTESLHSWDIAAAGLIAIEAGAVSTRLSEGSSTMPPALRGEEYLVATTGDIRKVMRAAEILT